MITERTFTLELELVPYFFHIVLQNGSRWISSYIANCVFNVFLCYTTIMLNSVTIHAITKISSLPKSLKTLLLSLATSDLCVGLLSGSTCANYSSCYAAGSKC